MALRTDPLAGPCRTWEILSRTHFVFLLPAQGSLSLSRPFCPAPPCGIEVAFVGLNQGDCLHHGPIQDRPSPVVKHKPGQEQQPHCAAPYHPDFTSVFAEPPFFVSSQKKAFAQGRGGLFLLLPPTVRLKERLMGESLPRKPGYISPQPRPVVSLSRAMFFVNYLSLSLFIKEKSSKAGRKEQDIGVRGPLRPPRCFV